MYFILSLFVEINILINYNLMYVNLIHINQIKYIKKYLIKFKIYFI